MTDGFFVCIYSYKTTDSLIGAQFKLIIDLLTQDVLKKLANLMTPKAYYRDIVLSLPDCATNAMQRAERLHGALSPPGSVGLKS